MPLWTKDKVAELKRRWADQQPAKDIASALGHGFTKNAVIGKARRENLAARGPSITAKRRLQSDRFNLPMTRPYRPHLHQHQHQPKDPAEPAKILRATAVSSPQTIETLEPHHCRYPIGDPGDANFHFCGAEKLPGVSYCEPHARIAYQNFGVTPAPRLHKKKREYV